MTIPKTFNAQKTGSALRQEGAFPPRSVPERKAGRSQTNQLRCTSKPTRCGPFEGRTRLGVRLGSRVFRACAGPKLHRCCRLPTIAAFCWEQRYTALTSQIALRLVSREAITEA